MDPKHLSQQEWNVLLRAVTYKVFGRCDPEDALQAALKIALQYNFDPNREGGASLKSFVLTVADRYACGLWHHSGVDRNSTSLDIVDDADDTSHHEYLVGSYDRIEDSRIDDHTIRAIIKHLEHLPNHKRISRQHAADMLETLVESIENDAGIGIDELEAFHTNEPASRDRRTRQARYRLERRPQEACRQYRANMCRAHHMNLKQLYNAQCLLRQATRQAVREGCFEYSM
jgi:hypothetical protein